MAMVWSLFEHRPSIEVVVITLVVFTALLWLNIGIKNLWKNRKKAENKEKEQIELPTLTSAEDTLNHFLVEDKQRRYISILSGLPEKPVVYPVVLRNTRPIPVDIKGYEATILWDNQAVETIKWQAPSAFTTAGIRVGPSYDDMSPVDSIRIEGDSPRELQLHVNLLKISHWPDKSPKWSVKGHLNLECIGESKTKPFDLSKEYYELKQEEWDKLKTELGKAKGQLNAVPSDS